MSAPHYRWIKRRQTKDGGGKSAGTSAGEGRSAAELARALEISPLFASVLIARGVEDVQSGTRFLDPDVSHLAPVELMPDLALATERMETALRRKEQVAVVGHDDLDGVGSSVVLIDVLRGLGLSPLSYIPHRPTEGYGVTPGVIERLERRGVNLVIGVDFGVSSDDGVAFARQRGIDVIIIDHHEPPPALPDAVAVIDPKRGDADYPFRELAGVGVVYRIAHYWAGRLPVVEPDGSRELAMRRADEALDLVSLGTVADKVPLRAENRLLVTLGLPTLGRRPGVAAVIRAAGCGGGELNARKVASRIVPLLSSGRAEAGKIPTLALLSATAEEPVREALWQLEEEREARSRRSRRALERVWEKVQENPPGPSQRAVLVSVEQLPIDVAGYCAGRLAERLKRPSVVVAERGEEAVGQIRGPAGVNLLAGLEEAAHLFIGFGGHRQAAGFSLPSARIKELKEILYAYFERELSDEDLLPFLEIDAELPLDEVDAAAARELNRLEPIGVGNGPAVLLARGVEWRDVVAITEAERPKEVTDAKASGEETAEMGEGPLELLRWSSRPQDVLYTVEERRDGRVTIRLLDARASAC